MEALSQVLGLPQSIIAEKILTFPHHFLEFAEFSSCHPAICRVVLCVLRAGKLTKKIPCGLSTLETACRLDMT